MSIEGGSTGLNSPPSPTDAVRCCRTVGISTSIRRDSRPLSTNGAGACDGGFPALSRLRAEVIPTTTTSRTVLRSRPRAVDDLHCACYPTRHSTLEEAPVTVRPRLPEAWASIPASGWLDPAAGWGGRSGTLWSNSAVTAIGVTLSAERSWAQLRIKGGRARDRAEFPFTDYASSSRPTSTRLVLVGLTEHIGVANYPSYVGFIRASSSPSVGC